MNNKKISFSWLRIMCVAVVALFSMSATAQKNDKTIYSVVEEMPQYADGDVALLQFLRDNIKYPKEAEENGHQGKVIVKLLIEKNGTVSKYEVAQSVTSSLDAEALRVVKLLPGKWKPAKNKGKEVRCYFSLPITFGLK